MSLGWANVLGLGKHTVSDRKKWSKFVCVCPKKGKRNKTNCFGQSEVCKSICETKGPEKGVTWFGEDVFLNISPKTKSLDGVCKLCYGFHDTKTCDIYYVKVLIQKYNRNIKKLYDDLETSLNMLDNAAINNTTDTTTTAEADDLLLSKPIKTKTKTKTKYVPPHLRKGASISTETVNKTLYVSNISENVTDQELRYLFRKFGYVAKLKLVRDRETGQSKGHAYITYEHRNDAQKALDKMHNYPIGHQLIYLEWSKNKRR